MENIKTIESAVRGVLEVNLAARDSDNVLYFCLIDEVAFERGMAPFRDFMYGQTQTKDVQLFMQISDIEWDGALESIPNYILVPSFIVSELRSAFLIANSQMKKSFILFFRLCFFLR